MLEHAHSHDGLVKGTARRASLRLLCLIGAVSAMVACSDNAHSPTGLTAPTPSFITLVPVGALDYTTPDAQAETTVRAMQTNTTAMASDIGVTPPTFVYDRVIGNAASLTRITTPASPSLSRLTVAGISTSQAKNPQTAPPPPIAFYLPNGCKKAYIDCVQDCIMYRGDFNTALGNFARANSDFWDNIINPFHEYLNHVSGGPPDQMRDAYYSMASAYRYYTAGDCRHYL